MGLMDWLGIGTGVGSREDNKLAGIEQALASYGADRARYLACFAYILTRVARADHQVSDAEITHMAQVVRQWANVDEAQATLIVRIAREAGHSRGTDDYLITREFERLSTREEKLALLDCLFEIAAADAAIATTEDNEVRRVASELKLEHADYIAVRQRHLEHLNVLKRPE